MKKNNKKTWEIVVDDAKINTPSDVINYLLVNRGIVTKKHKQEFFKPRHPNKISLDDISLDKKSVSKAIGRIKVAHKNSEKVLVYGDYDADGICATAILWETLYEAKIDAVPFIPDRFSDGYGLNEKSIKSIKEKYPDLKLIITVDNGVVANSAVEYAKEIGIDVIITDHHEPGETYPDAYCIVHSQIIGGAGVAWFLARELRNKFSLTQASDATALDLAAIGTVADQIPLVGVNRSLVSFGLTELRKGYRLGIKSLLNRAGVDTQSIDTNTIGFVIGPRLNAMGRLEHAIDSLRLLCTKNTSKANELANYLEKTNKKRQEIVEKVVLHARKAAMSEGMDSIIVIADSSYHEGVVGLAASKLVEEFYRPAIVFSKLGKESKASARSVNGFNIIEAIREHKDLLLAYGGHPMAAGVKITTSKIDTFRISINKSSKNLLNSQMLTPRVSVEFELPFKVLDWDLLKLLQDFEPHGSGNQNPVFLTKKVAAWNARSIGNEGKHLKLKVVKNGKTVDVIGFGFGYLARSIPDETEVDIVYCFEANEFRGVKSLQLRLKDIDIM